MSEDSEIHEWRTHASGETCHQRVDHHSSSRVVVVVATLVIVIDDSRAYVALSAGREDVWQESHSGSHQPMARQPPQKQHDCVLRLASAGALRVRVHIEF